MRTLPLKNRRRSRVGMFNIKLITLVMSVNIFLYSLVHLKGDWHEFEAKSRKRKERQAAKEREAQASRREALSTGSGGPSTEPRQR